MWVIHSLIAGAVTADGVAAPVQWERVAPAASSRRLPAHLQPPQRHPLMLALCLGPHVRTVLPKPAQLDGPPTPQTGSLAPHEPTVGTARHPTPRGAEPIRRTPATAP